MRYFFKILFLIFFILSLSSKTYAERVVGKAAIIIDYQTNETLFEVNADTPNYPASLAKIMTLYMTFEALENGELTLDQQLKVSDIAASRSPSKLYLKPGSTISVKDSIMTLITKSANDVATVISETLADSEKDFAKKMTLKAKQLGMMNTTYKNASGLPNRAQLTTARDTAILSRALINNFPNYYKLFKEQKFSWNGKTYKNHNKMLKTYPGTDGIKTGYIYASGFQLALSAVRNNRRLIGVYFGGDSAKHRDNTLSFLMDRSFGKSESAKIETNGEYKIVVGTFKYEKNAKKQVKIIKSIFPEILKNKKNQIIKRKGESRLWYETQFQSFEKKEAQKVCSIMKKNNIDCFIKRKI